MSDTMRGAETDAKLDLIANDPRKEADWQKFIRACQTDAECYGLISVQRVRAAMSNQYGLTVHPQTYASFWARATRDGLMVTTEQFDRCTHKATGNGGKVQFLRRWIGGKP